jgi:hypothetical protein
MMPGQGNSSVAGKKGFGNVNYNGRPLKFHAPDTATANISALLKKNLVILLCACKDVNTCHRKVAAEYLAEQLGVEVKHLTPADALGLTSTATEEPAMQGNLF